MNEINLLRYHDRSAREIHMLLCGELTDEFFSRVVVVGKNKKVSGKHPVLTFFLTMLLAFICSLGVSYYVYTKFIAVNNTGISTSSIIPEPIRKVIKKEKEVVEKVKPDPYVMSGYSNIGEIELGSGGSESRGIIISSDYTKPKESNKNKPEQTIRPITIPGEPIKRIPDQNPDFMPVYSGTYLMQFFDSDPSDTDFITALANKNDMKMTKLATRSRMVTHWNAYYIDKKSKTRIAGYGVKFIKSFDSRDAAKGYLKNSRIRGFVAAITAPEPIYDWEVCCAKKEEADKLANGSGVDMKKIKIIKLKE